MRTRLAMMSCKGPHTTPWMNPQGGETGLRILHMVEGEKITLEEGKRIVDLPNPGEYSFHPTEAFRFHKVRTIEGGSPTMVEVLYA